MLLALIIIVAVIGAPALAIVSVVMRTKKADANTAGYVFNGKTWVTWLLLLCIIAALFIGFVMPIPLISGQPSYHPDWSCFRIILSAIMFYVCYAIIAFVPATAEEIEESKAAGNTVLGNVGSTAASAFKLILVSLGAILAALPGMIGSALNPVLAVKTIGNTVYKVIGTGFSHVIGGIIGLFLFALLAFVIIAFAAYIFAAIGTFALGILAIIKFFKNMKKK